MRSKSFFVKGNFITAGIRRIMNGKSFFGRQPTDLLGVSQRTDYRTQPVGYKEALMTPSAFSASIRVRS